MKILKIWQKIQEYAHEQNKRFNSRIVLQIENVCTQACKELEEEFNSNKNNSKSKMKIK